MIQDDGPLFGGHAPGETAAERNPDILTDFFLETAGCGGDELTGGFVEEEHGRGITLEDVLRPVQELSQQVLSVQPGERGVGDGLQVTKLVASAPHRGSGRPHKHSVVTRPPPALQLTSEACLPLGLLEPAIDVGLERGLGAPAPADG